MLNNTLVVMFWSVLAHVFGGQGKLVYLLPRSHFLSVLTVQDILKLSFLIKKSKKFNKNCFTNHLPISIPGLYNFT